MNNKNIIIRDRLDREFYMRAEAGIEIKKWLLKNYIPRSSIVLKVNGAISDDDSYIIDEADTITIDMVRAYQLPEYCTMLGLWENDRTFSNNSKPAKTIYSSELLWFNQNGVSEIHKASMNEAEFVEWLEQRFVDGIVDFNLIKENQSICLALSGGRDSLALLYLLRRTAHKLPKHNLIGCTVSPTAASSEDVQIAKESINNLGVTDYSILDLNYVNETMNLKNGFDSAIDSILQSSGRGLSIACWHGIMRACVERFSQERGISTIAFGYQHEDLLASILRSQQLGVWFGESAQEKKWGDFSLISPLWTITKKELTIYLNIIAPKKHSSQGSPTDFDRGDHNRDINYFAADLLTSTIPGYGFNLFEGHKRSSQWKNNITYYKCHNCATTYSNLGISLPELNVKYCNTCLSLIKNGEIERLRIVE
jgi:tRNA(Ile)-lysidine synthase TilS/MesJ